MADYSYDRKKMESLASEQDKILEKAAYIKAMGYDEKEIEARDTEYGDYVKHTEDLKKAENVKEEVTNEELLEKAEEIVKEDVSNLPSDEELLAEIDSLLSENIEKSEEKSEEEKVEKSEEKKEEDLEKGQGDFGGDDSKESGGGYQSNSDAPDQDFPGEGSKKKEKKGGDDSEEEGGGYKANSDAPSQNFPGEGDSSASASGGDDSKEEGGGYRANSEAPKEEFPGSIIMKSLDSKFDVLIECVKTMNSRIDDLVTRQDEVEKSKKDEVADEVIEKAQKDEKGDLEKSLTQQIADLTSTVKTVVEQNAELQKSLKTPATRRQSLTNYNQIQKGAPEKRGVDSLSKAEKLRKLEKLRKSQPELGNDIIKLNSSGILSERARHALEDAE